MPDTGWYLLDVSGGQGGDASNDSHAGGTGAQIQASVRSDTGWPLFGTAWMKPSIGWLSV